MPLNCELQFTFETTKYSFIFDILPLSDNLTTSPWNMTEKLFNLSDPLLYYLRDSDCNCDGLRSYWQLPSAAHWTGKSAPTRSTFYYQQFSFFFSWNLIRQMSHCLPIVEHTLTYIVCISGCALESCMNDSTWGQHYYTPLHWTLTIIITHHIISSNT